MKYIALILSAMHALLAIGALLELISKKLKGEERDWFVFYIVWFALLGLLYGSVYFNIP